MDSDKIVCYCMSVTNGMIRDAVASGARTLEEVQAITLAGTVCGTCNDNVQHLIEYFIKEHDNIPESELNMIPDETPCKDGSGSED